MPARKHNYLKILYILRHAKAAAEDKNGDVERPLAKRGRKAAAAMGDYLAMLAPAPRLVLCSSARRTRETLDQILPSLRPAPKVLYEDGLYLASPGHLIERLRELPGAADSVLLVGHNPGLHQLALTLAGEGGGLAEAFPTAALAVLRLGVAWEALRPRSAKLIDYQTPKSLNRDPELDPD
ncbi:MAG TPA: histidine phosphatase family protein [Stellaceae bacterium]|nr:histidine phosphatase family protein [Stellaceae bacterium]